MLEKSRLLRLLAALFVLSVLAGACGDDDGSGEATVAEAVTDTDDGSESPDSEPERSGAENGEEGSGGQTDTPGEPDPDPALAEPIKFPVINMEEGLVAYPETTEALRIMADYYNESLNGIVGHPIEIDLCTAGDDPESAQACAQRFANDDSAPFVFLAGVINSAPVFEVLGPGGVDKPILGHLLWDVPDSLQPGVYSHDPGLLPMAYELIRWAVEEDGVTNLAVLVDDSDLGQATLSVVDFFLAGLGGATLTPVPISVGQADFLAPMTAAGVEKADGLALLIAESAACQTTRDALEALGQGDTPVYVGDWCLGEEFRQAGTAEGWRVVVGQNGALADDPEAEMFRQLYADAGADAPFGLAYSAAAGMDFARQVLEIAIDKATGAIPTSEQIHAAAAEWSGSFFLGPDTMSCPGPAPWVSTCNSAARIVTLEDSKWVAVSDFNKVDVSIFDPLLG